MGQEEVTFDFPPPQGPYEFVFNNALLGLWLVTIVLFMTSLYFLVRALQHRSLSSLRYQFVKYALSAEALFFVVLFATSIHEMIRMSIPSEDLFAYALFTAPSFFGGISWAYVLRHATVRPDFMTITEHNNKSTRRQ